MLLEANLPLLQRKLRRLCRHGSLPAREADDFRSWALLKLIDDDYRILGKWEGRSSFSGYLTVVLRNLLRDYRNHLWGKRQPCAASFRRRQERRQVSDSMLLQVAIDGQVESRIEEAERMQIARRLHELLVPLLQSLPAEDRLILKLYFFDGFSMAAIAPILGRPQKKLYVVRDCCLKKLRRSLDKDGLDSKRVRDLFGHFCFDLKTPLLE